MSPAFLLAEGVASLRRVPGASIIGALLTGVSLAIVGGFLMISLGYSNELSRARANAVVEVFLEDSLTLNDPTASRAIANQIARFPEVLNVTIRTPAQGAALFGDAVVIDTSLTDGTLPIPTTLRVDLKTESQRTDEIESIRSRLQAISGVDDIAFAGDLLRKVEQRFQLFTRIATVVGILLLLCIIGVVAVTAQLTVVTRRSMIRTMRLLGAERRWIIAPFVLQGCLIGLSGGVIAGGGIFLVGEFIPETLTSRDSGMLWNMILAFPIAGGILGILGSGLAGGYSIARGATV